ncbi:MAG: mandelate racemase/muconate lactonizing enzyme family protein, partial [Anaerolineae bacterium]
AAKGITAIRSRGFHAYDDADLHDHRLEDEQQVEYMAAIREAVGDEVDIILECHGRYDPQWAIELARRVEPYRPFMIEDPVRHENPQALAQLRAHTGLPLAIGERYHDKWDFRETIVNQYANYLRPDICHCGGISEMCKIAALGETYYMELIPHNNAGPLGTAATLHAALAIPNVAMIEAPWVNGSGETDVVRPYPEVVDGYALPLEGPGLGIAFDEALARSKAFTPRMQPRLDALDGSVRDF